MLDECELRTKKKRMKPGEYQAGLRGDSWKLDLIQAINETLEYSITREDFITNMEMEGYEVSRDLQKRYKEIKKFPRFPRKSGELWLATTKSRKRQISRCLAQVYGMR